LHDRRYEVHGLVRPGQQECDRDFERLPISKLVHKHEVCITDEQAVHQIVAAVRPDECYHLAAYTFAGADDHAAILEVNVLGTQHVLHAVHQHAPACRVFVAASSEIFGAADVYPQTEETPRRPQTLYGVSKSAACDLARYYRTVRKLHASCGILYNHESPRRGRQFVTRKITSAVACIKEGLQSELLLGNLEDQRDWGHARDYVRAMWLMLQQSSPDEYVIATGALHRVRDFVQSAFERAGLDWRQHVRTDPRFYRPAKAVPLAGCSRKARERLGWTTEFEFAQLVNEMVDEDLANARFNCLGR
jgi:GDPmannose 4,6-dehydratase